MGSGMAYLWGAFNVQSVSSLNHAHSLEPEILPSSESFDVAKHQMGTSVL